MKKVITICLLVATLLVGGMTMDAKTTKKNYKKSTSRNSISRQRNGIINGHTAIDLGLSVRWATENINANTSYQTGNWFAWRDYDIAKKEWGLRGVCQPYMNGTNSLTNADGYGPVMDMR